MKKATYLIIIMFSMVLLSSSCKKDDPVIHLNNDFFLDQIEGNWNFVSIEYNGQTYTSEADINNDYNIKDNTFTIFSFSIAKPDANHPSELNVRDAYIKNLTYWTKTFDLLFDNVILNSNIDTLNLDLCLNKSFIFSAQLADTLKLKITYDDTAYDYLDGAIYTFVK